MFPEPEPVRFRLSMLTSCHKATKRSKPKWSKIPGNRPCDECAAVQWENRGKGWPRNPASQKRTIGELSLLLCNAHAELWRELDG